MPGLGGRAVARSLRAVVGRTGYGGRVPTIAAAAFLAVSLHTAPLPEIEPVMSPALRLNQGNRTARDQDRREDREREQQRKAAPQSKPPRERPAEPKSPAIPKN